MNVLYVKNQQHLVELVKQQVEAVAASKIGPIAIGIPGGRSAEAIITGLLSVEDSIVARIQLYLVDERLSDDTNAKALGKSGLDKAFATGRMNPSQFVIPTETMDSAPSLSLLYLGVGEDGHIASLFPGSYPALAAFEAPLVATIDNSPKPPSMRVTFTYRALQESACNAQVFLLFLGESKRDAYRRIADASVEALPARFFLQSWCNVTIITDLKEKDV